MSEEKKPFTVSDRRHFTPAGEAREPSSEESPAQVAADPAEEEPRIDPGRPPSALKVTLVGFLVGLGAQAAALLQAPPGEDPGDTRAARLEEARHVIAILEMLKEKTEGRRTTEEAQVLEGLLYELRMSYLEYTRAAQT